MAKRGGRKRAARFKLKCGSCGMIRPCPCDERDANFARGASEARAALEAIAPGNSVSAAGGRR